MAKKLVCDQCGAEINPQASGTVIEMWRPCSAKILKKDLCVSCALQLKNWFDGKAKIVIEEGEK